MAISFLSGTTQGSCTTGSSSLGITTSGLSVGDLQICGMVLPSSATVTVVPSDWTTWLDTTFAGPALRLAFYTRVVAAGSGTSTWSFSSSVVFGQEVTNFRGVDPTVPFNIPPQAAGVASAGSGTNMTSVDVVPMSGLCRPLYFWDINWSTNASTNTTTLPGTVTSCGQVQTAASSGHRARFAYLTSPVGGTAAGPQTCTASASGAWLAALMVLRDPAEPLWAPPPRALSAPSAPRMHAANW